MSEKEELIAQFIAAGKTLYERGYASGAAGNMSQLLPDGTVVATPTGSCLGQLVAEELSIVDMEGNLLSGKKATKEVKFHLAIYQNNPEVKSVVHLHCCYCTAYACLKDLDPHNAIRPVTPYVVMRPAHSVLQARLHSPSRRHCQGRRRSQGLFNGQPRHDYLR